MNKDQTNFRNNNNNKVTVFSYQMDGIHVIQNTNSNNIKKVLLTIIAITKFLCINGTVIMYDIVYLPEAY